MKFEYAPYFSYADLPVVYVLELGGEEFLGLREPDGSFRQIDSITEVPDTEYAQIEMFGDSLGLIIPCHIHTLTADGNLAGTLGIRVIDGRPGCFSIIGRLDKAITGSFLRQLPIAQLVREATTANVVRVLMTESRPFAAKYVEGGLGFGRLQADLQEELAHLEEKGRRRVIDDSFLKMVAHIYRTALRLKVPPARHVQEMLGPTTPANARRWIAAARATGFLGPAPARGRAGEVTHELSVSS